MESDLVLRHFHNLLEGGMQIQEIYRFIIPVLEFTAHFKTKCLTTQHYLRSVTTDNNNDKMGNWFREFI